ncbi:THAP domain-containing protein 8 isoform X2 [Mustela putorius furo]|nr:THAP domain-containing protein 8 isoform X2 [Mustela putorius furo]
MGHEDWEPSCHQHLCSEHFTPSCFQWRWGVRYLRPDAVPSIFSPAPPAKRQQSSRNTEKPVVPPSPPEGTPLSPGPAVSVSAPGPVPLVVLGSASGAPEATTTVFLTPLQPPPAPAGQQPGVRAQHPLARLDAVLGALRRRVRSLQRRQEQHELRLRALEQLAQQLCREGPPSPMEKQAPGCYSNLPEVRQPRRCTTRIQARGLTPQQASALLLESSLPGP